MQRRYNAAQGMLERQKGEAGHVIYNQSPPIDGDCGLWSGRADAAGRHRNGADAFGPHWIYA